MSGLVNEFQDDLFEMLSASQSRTFRALGLAIVLLIVAAALTAVLALHECEAPPAAPKTVVCPFMTRRGRRLPLTAR